MKTPKVIHILMSFLFTLQICIVSCTRKSNEPIYYGKESCAHCKMTLFDKRFGGELVTKKGKVYKFDSIECLHSFENKNTDLLKDEYSTYLVNSFKNGNLISADSAFIYNDDQLTSPMGKGYLVSDNENDFKIERTKNNLVMKWNDLKPKLQ